MASKVIRVLATGKHEAMGRKVIEGLRPEVEGLHFILSSNIENELPYLLQNRLPPNPSSKIASEILGRPVSLSETPPQALLLGGAYTDEMISDLKSLIQKSSNSNSNGNNEDAGPNHAIREIPWVRIDPAKSKYSPAEHKDLYAADVVSRFKETLLRLDEEGKLDGANGEVYSV